MSRKPLLAALAACALIPVAFLVPAANAVKPIKPTVTVTIPIPGPIGPIGPTGLTGAVGPVGPQGEVGPVAPSEVEFCQGNKLRFAHIPNTNSNFMSATAKLRNQPLYVVGNVVAVDMRAARPGLYNINIKARYRKSDGGVKIVKSTRHWSVACS